MCADRSLYDGSLSDRPFGGRLSVPAPSTLAEAILTEGGRVTFARFMELALTHPTLGYYSRTDRLLGPRGDFSTAPALLPFFNKTVARLATELVDASMALTGPAGSAGSAGTPFDRQSVVELGGGEGHLAGEILRFWEQMRPDLRGRLSYRIVEVGAGLRRRQSAALDRLAAAGWDVGWGRDLEEACAGTVPAVIIGNEFLDALPVHLIDVKEKNMREAYVEAREAGLVQIWGDPSDQAVAEVDLLFGTLDPRRLESFTEDGILEISPGLGDLFRQVAELMLAGSLVSIDYGWWFSGTDTVSRTACGRQAWKPERTTQRRRTIRGYFKHQVVADPLARAGRQDLTADVDFSALDLHGQLEGFETVLFTTLSAFLRAGGAVDELKAFRDGTAEAVADGLEADRQATVLTNLLDEQDWGGAYKVMVQVRG